MHVEFAGQEVKWQPMMRRLLQSQRLCAADDGCWRRLSTRIPRAECFAGDTNSLVSLVCPFSAVSQAESNQPVVETC
jgi:hypothetical protein